MVASQDPFLIKKKASKQHRIQNVCLAHDLASYLYALRSLIIVATKSLEAELDNAQENEYVLRI